MASVSAVLALATGCADEPVTTAAAPPAPGPVSVLAPSPGGLERPGPDDVAFVTSMLPHHDQGLQLAELANARGDSPAVRELGFRMSRRHAEEIGQIEGVLRSWGMPRRTSGVPDTAMPMAMSGAMGMASPAEVADLDTRRGADFDRRWLPIMIRHHEGAIAAARAVLATPTTASVRSLAEEIVAIQQAQVVEMRRLVGAAP